jgi:GxxExxY protein
MLTGDALTRRIIGLAIEVHRHLGPGLLESAYEQCLSYELTAAAIPHECQVPLPVAYKDTRVDLALRADVVVADEVLLELKAVERLLPVHEAQVLTYLRMTRFRIGLLINFHALRLKDGLRRFVT